MKFYLSDKGGIVINQGILSNVLLLVIIILILTDWLDGLVERFAPKRIIAGLLILIILLFSFEVTILGWRVNIGGYIFPAVIFLILMFSKVKDRFYLFTASFLLGATYFLIKELIRLDPILLVVKEIYQITVLIVLIIMIVVSALEYRITLLIGGILLGEFLYHFHHRFQFYQFVLGDGLARDIFWLAIVQVVVFHYILSQIKDFIKRKELNFFKFRRVNND